MNTLNYLQEYKAISKALVYSLVFLFIFSCENDNEDEKDLRHLGYPLNGVVTVRTKPFSLLSKVPNLEKNLDNDSSSLSSANSDNSNNQFNIIENYLASFPSLNTLTNDFLLSLEPDLSTYWIMRSGLENHSYYTSLYLKVGNIAHLEQFLKERSIPSETITPTIKMSLIDDKLEEHLYFLRTSDHLLILMNWGDAEIAKKVVKSCVYSNKKLLLDHYSSLFNSKNDVDIKIESNESLESLLPSPLLRDLSKSFSASLGLNILPNSLEVDIVPSPEWENPLDSLLTAHPLKESGLMSLSTKIELNALEHLLTKYKLTSPLNYELKKINLTMSKLKQQFNGSLYTSYLGEKVTRSKSITYEYDDDFNQVEKVVYTSSSSFDFRGFLGLNNRTLTEKYFTKNNFISKIGVNSYQPIIGSDSRISFSDDFMVIGNQKDSEAISNGKLILQVNSIDQLPKMGALNQMINKVSLDRLRLFISADNSINFKVKIKGDPYNYLLKAKEFLNPSL